MPTAPKENQAKKEINKIVVDQKETGAKIKTKKLREKLNSNSLEMHFTIGNTEHEKITKQDFNDSLWEADVNNDKMIDKNEFVAYVFAKVLLKAKVVKKLKELFCLISHDVNDGKIEPIKIESIEEWTEKTKE